MRWGRTVAVSLGWVVASCGRAPAEADGESSTETTSSDDGSDDAGESGSDASSDDGSTGGGESSDEDTTSDATEGTETGPEPCTKNVVLMGYWPPTNEMLRQWSTSPEQNPGSWEGENWRGLGYDVYAFFPEFPPDGDPSNDPIGSPGAVGSPESDLQVDYQDTSEDFWRIVDELDPIIVMTTSRGGQIGWEIEAIEGGHGMGNQDPSEDWSSDGFGAETQPTMETVDPRTWDAISQYRAGVTIDSQLPMDAILDATDALGLTNVEINYGTSGNFLSGFLGLHGVAYQAQSEVTVAAGHIHVGFGLPVEDAVPLMETSVETVLTVHPAEDVGCSSR